MFTPPASSRSRAWTRTRWWRACARAGTAAWCPCPARTAWRRWSTPSPSPATTWSASAPATSPAGRTPCPASEPLTVIGAASNLIVRDGGVPGLVVKLGGAFGGVSVGEDGVVAGAAALDAAVAEHAAAAGLSGLEFLCGIPGSIGGAVAMNAGAYGTEIADVLDWAEVATPRGVERLPALAFRFAY